MRHSSAFERIARGGLILLAAAALPSCGIFDAITGGCQETGTTGAEGVVIFRFLQSDQDLSSSSGNAFAAGTKASLGIEAASGYESLPAWNARSSNEEIFSVEDVEEDAQDDDYPVTLSMLKEGEAKVKVVGRADGITIDFVALKVVTPDGLQAGVSHPVLGRMDAGEKIALAAGGTGCVLDFFPFKKDGTSRKVLFGEFDVTCDIEDQGLSFATSPITADRPYASATVAAGAAGSYDLTLLGPGGGSVVLTVLSVSSRQVESIDLVFTPWSGDGKHAGDWGYLTGVQYASGTPLCGGHTVVFMTDSPAIVALDLEGVPETAGDTVRFILQTSGVARIMAMLEASPSVAASIDLVVQPQPTY